MELLPEDVLKLVVAMLLGGLIGAEREFRDKAAGFRTIIFISVGATAFTVFSQKLGGIDDPVRIAANVVTGIGFLGAGAILREGSRIRGLTTAATIWLAAALGMGVGGGYYLLAGAITAAALLVLWLLPAVEERIDRARETRVYEVECALKPAKFRELEQMFRNAGLRVKSHKQIKSGQRMVCVWEAYGALEKHERAMTALFDDGEVAEFRF